MHFLLMAAQYLRHKRRFMMDLRVYCVGMGITPFILKSLICYWGFNVSRFCFNPRYIKSSITCSRFQNGGGYPLIPHRVPKCLTGDKNEYKINQITSMQKTWHYSSFVFKQITCTTFPIGGNPFERTQMCPQNRKTANNWRRKRNNPQRVLHTQAVRHMVIWISADSWLH
jgi:hypothetical protein